MKKIVILHTDVSSEADKDEQDTLIQAQSVAGALVTLGYQPVFLPFLLDFDQNIKNLRDEAPLAVFNLVESFAGQGNMIHFATSLLDFLQIPYTGCRTEAMFLTSNKPLAKQLLDYNHIATPFWLTADGKAHGYQTSDTFILKASWEEASVGLDEHSIFQSSDVSVLLDTILHRKRNTGYDYFAESFIDGREINLAILSSDRNITILPPSEILFEDYPPTKFKILDYRAKWLENTFEYNHTKRSFDFSSQDSFLLDSLKEIALTCWNVFGLKGYARVDFRIDSKGQPWVLEINANPCLSPDAGFAAALDVAGMSYSEAIDAILLDALDF